MLEKLDGLFSLQTTASKISKMSELVSLHYRRLQADWPKNIDKMTELLERLRSMKATIHDSLAVGILLALIEE